MMFPGEFGPSSGQMMPMFGSFANSGFGQVNNGLGAHHHNGLGGHHHGGFGKGPGNLASENSNIGQPVGAGSGGLGGFGFGNSGGSSGLPQFGGGQDFGGHCSSNQSATNQSPWTGGLGGFGFGNSGGGPGLPQFGGCQDFGGQCSSNQSATNQSPWTVNNTGNGQAHIDLGNYTLDLNQANAGWTLTNKATGETTAVAGDPHVSESNNNTSGNNPSGDNQSGNNWTFKQPTTFDLNNGIKLSVKTTPAGNGATVSSELDISDPSGHGMRVTNLNGNGQLQVTDGLNGNALNASNSGNNVLFENGNNGWKTPDGQTVDAALADRRGL